MSVSSLTVAEDNPVTSEAVDKVCVELGVELKQDEREDYRRLLAVFHETSEQVMSLPDYVPQVDLSRFPREDIRFPDAAENTHGAWAWRCSIKDKNSRGKTLLDGRTIAIKDIVSVKDVPMLMGTAFVNGYIPDTDATLVTRILESGGHIVGKSVCENMCHSASSHSAATGVVENPFAKGYSSGGSSSGSGVLVALGDVDMAIGADQGGSIRVPAANCGIVGLKPTFGLVPYTACGSNEPTNDHAGPMTRTVLENALLLSAIAGSDGIDDRGWGAPSPSLIPNYSMALTSLENPKSLAGKRMGIISESILLPALDPRVLTCFRNAAERFTSLGAIVEEVSIPMHTHGGAIWTGVSKVGGYLTKTCGSPGRRGYQMLELNQLVHPMKQENWDNAYVSTKNVYLNGAYGVKMFPGLLAKSTNLARKLKDDYDAALAKYDLLITPTLPLLAASHAAPDATPLEQIARQVGLTSNTAPFNQSGHPVLAMPIGMLEITEGPLKGSGTKLPVSMQIIGKWWDEEQVYRAAYAWELTNNWRTT